MGLITKEVEVKITCFNHKYYEDLGYAVPYKLNKDGKKVLDLYKTIQVNVLDLLNNSHQIVQIECEECHKIYPTLWRRYIMHNRSGKTYCNSCINKLFNSGENNAQWNKKLTDEERLKDRNLPEYRDFIRKVLIKDKYTCQHCKRHTDDCEAHHLNSYDWCISQRTDLNNGVALCHNCHKNFHHLYGYGKNTLEQFLEWNNDVDYNSFKTSQLPTAKAVYCLEEGKVYRTSRDFSHSHKGVKSATVHEICNKASNLKQIHGFHLLWNDERLKMSKQDWDNYYEWCEPQNITKVYCITTSEVFNSITEACNKYPTAKNIGAVCLGKRVSSGVSEDGEKLCWVYYKDYCSGNYQIKNSKRYKPVICLTTMKQYDGISQGAIEENCDVKKVRACCKQKSAHMISKDYVEKSWMFISDYNLLSQEEKELIKQQYNKAQLVS